MIFHHPQSLPPDLIRGSLSVWHKRREALGSSPRAALVGGIAGTALRLSSLPLEEHRGLEENVHLGSREGYVQEVHGEEGASLLCHSQSLPADLIRGSL